MYKLIQNSFTKKIDTVLRIVDMTYIPFSYDNTDYQEYLKWLEEGNTPLPAEEIRE